MKLLGEHGGSTLMYEQTVQILRGNNLANGTWTPFVTIPEL